MPLPGRVIRLALLFCSLLARWQARAIDGPLTPEESLKYLKTEPGLRIELVAAEPMVVDPVAVAWDERGRMFVVEDRGYPTGPGKGKPPVGQVVMLESTHGDGKYDKRMVYVDGLSFPNGVLPWRGGVYVTCAPYLYYFKDTEGDGKVDVKKVIFKGFQDLSTTQLRVSHPTLNLDNWVYLTSGLTAAKVLSPEHPDRPAVFLNRVDGRFRPGTDEIEETGGTAQFGQTFDRFGRKFICSNRNHIQQVMLQPQYIKRNPNLAVSEVVEDIPDHGAACRVYPLSENITTAAAHAGYITSACGIMIYEGTALPPEYRGNSFTCEPAGNLVHRDVLTSDGVAFIAKRAYPTNEFLASPDNWFRPVNVAIGPDGALYVCDMYRKTIEHPDYLPEATRKVTDFESGKTMGRIYRILREEPPGSRVKPIERLNFEGMKARDLVALLRRPNIWTRMTAQRLLLEQQDQSAVPHLELLAARGRSPETRVHSLRTLEGLGALSADKIERALADSNPAVREHAIQLAETALMASHGQPGGTNNSSSQLASLNSSKVAVRLVALADDPDARVRFQCALSLGSIPIRFDTARDTADPVVQALVKIVMRRLDDKWTRAAVLSSVAGREEPFLRELRVAAHSSETQSLPPLMADLGRILGASQPLDRLTGVLQSLVSSSDTQDLPWQMAAVAGLGDGLRSRGFSNKESLPLATLCKDNSKDLVALFQRAARFSADEKQPLETRLASVGLLGQADYASTGAILTSLVAPREPPEIQTAAVRALGQMPNREAAAILVKRETWNAYTPALRDVALSALIGNTNHLPVLMAALESGDVPPSTVNEGRRNALMKHKDETIRAKAVALFKDIEPSDRMKAYEESKSVLKLAPDSKNGHAVFQKLCTACHVFAGEGHTVGPDLTGIRNQPEEVLLLHIVVPEYEILPIYTCYNVDLKDAESFTGLLAGETPTTITLRMAQGLEQRIARSEIASMTASRLSLMPQELEKVMSKQDLADLLAFLKGK